MISKQYHVSQVEVDQMTAEIQAADRNQISGQQAPEREARFLPGIRMLVLGIAVLIVGAGLLWLAGRFSGGAAAALLWLGGPGGAAGAPLLRGLPPVVPRPPPAIPPFGKDPRPTPESGL